MKTGSIQSRWARCKAGEMASVIGEVRGTTVLRARSMPIFEMTVGQGLGTLKAMWFRGTYLQDKFKPGRWSRCTASWSRRARPPASSR